MLLQLLKFFFLAAQMMYNGWVLLLPPFIGHKWRPVWEGTHFYLFQKTKKHIAVTVCIRVLVIEIKSLCFMLLNTYYIWSTILKNPSQVVMKCTYLWQMHIGAVSVFLRVFSSLDLPNASCTFNKSIPTISAVCVKTCRNFFP